MSHVGKIAMIKLIDPDTLAVTEVMGRVSIDNNGQGLFVQVVEHNQAPPEKPARVDGVTLSDVCEAVCGYFQLPRNALRSPDRSHSLLFPRHVAMWLARTVTVASWPEIAAYFDRTHATAINSHTQIGQLIKDGDDRAITALDELAKMLQIPLIIDRQGGGWWIEKRQR